MSASTRAVGGRNGDGTVSKAAGTFAIGAGAGALGASAAAASLGLDGPRAGGLEILIGGGLVLFSEGVARSLNIGLVGPLFISSMGVGAVVLGILSLDGGTTAEQPAVETRVERATSRMDPLHA